MILRNSLIINCFAPSCINLWMTVKKTVSPVTKVIGVDVSQIQEMDRHLFKVAPSWGKAPKDHLLHSYHDSLLLSRGKLLLISV
jgi:hypothetical protein